MHHFTYRQGALWVEEVPLAHIAAKVGTPFYCYSLATISRHFYALKNVLKQHNPKIHFAVKANPSLAIINHLMKMGAGMDVVSRGEILLCLKAGVLPESIIYSGVGKSEEDIRYAISSGIGQINVESAGELKEIMRISNELHHKVKIAFRINPDMGAGGHAKITTGHEHNKFGVNFKDIDQLYREALGHPNIDLVGLSSHVGSQILDVRQFESVYALMRKTAERLRADGLPVHQLDLGGGIGVPYHPDDAMPDLTEYGRIVSRVFEGMDISLAFEPGRIICANAGVLVSRIIASNERRAKTYLVLDAAMNDLLRPTLYEAFHDVWPLNETKSTTGWQIYDFVGPICETSDTIAHDRRMAPLQVGDLVSVMSVGAYGYSMASNYNCRRLPAEVMVNQDQFHIIRERQGYDDMLSRQRLPDWQ